MTVAPQPPGGPQVRSVASLEEATAALAELGGGGAPLAGATWVMRAWMRGEGWKRTYVALHGIPGLTRIEGGDPTVLGALVTHTQLLGLGQPSPLAALAEAAARSGFPAVRNVATVAGNICAAPFPEAELVPALLALGASVSLVSVPGWETVELASYLESRDRRPAGELIESVTVPAPPGRRSAFERLSVRGGNEYALAAVAVALDPAGDGTARNVRVVVGAVDETACRSHAAEQVLEGKRIDAALAEAAGRAAAAELPERDGLDAPGWYRLAVLPALLRRAIARIIV